MDVNLTIIIQTIPILLTINIVSLLLPPATLPLWIQDVPENFFAKMHPPLERIIPHPPSWQAHLMAPPSRRHAPHFSLHPPFLTLLGEHTSSPVFPTAHS